MFRPTATHPTRLGRAGPATWKHTCPGTAPRLESLEGRLLLSTYPALDTSFNGCGFVHQDVLKATNTACALAVMPDGDIVWAGGYPRGSTFRDGQPEWAIFRTNQDGSPDDLFGPADNGFTSVSFGSATIAPDQPVKEILVHADNKILLTGLYQDSSSVWPALVRLDAEGNLDPTFGTGGKLRIDPLVKGDAKLDDVAIDPTNQSILVATSGMYSTTKGGKTSITAWNIVARYTDRGVLDTSFGTSGKFSRKVTWTDSALSLGDWWDGLRVNGDRSIDLVGTHDGTPHLARINSTGKQLTLGPIETFAHDLPNPPSYFAPGGGTFTPDGKLVCALSNPDVDHPDGYVRCVVWRNNADGTPDTSFSDDGMAYLDFNDYLTSNVTGQAYSHAEAWGLPGVPYLTVWNIDVQANEVPLAVDTDGSILVVGRLFVSIEGFPQQGRGILARFTPDGSLDPTFGIDGVSLWQIGSYPLGFYQVAIHPGRILGVGVHYDSTETGYDFTLARFDWPSSMSVETVTQAMVTMSPNPFTRTVASVAPITPSRRAEPDPTIPIPLDTPTLWPLMSSRLRFRRKA